MKNKYVFSVIFDMNGPVLDTFYKIKSSAVTNLDPISFKVAMKIDPHLCKEDERVIGSMMLRMQYAMAEGLFVVNTEDHELMREDLDHVIQSKYQEGSLVGWLQSSKV